MPYKIKKQYRLPGYDYSQSGSYHITVATKDRIQYFGEIKDEKMILSEIGVFSETNFADIAVKIKHIEIGEHIVMPDHIHLIINMMGDDVGTHLQARSYNHIAAPTGLQPLQKNQFSHS